MNLEKDLLDQVFDLGTRPRQPVDETRYVVPMTAEQLPKRYGFSLTAALDELARIVHFAKLSVLSVRPLVCKSQAAGPQNSQVSGCLCERRQDEQDHFAPFDARVEAIFQLADRGELQTAGPKAGTA